MKKITTLVMLFIGGISYAQDLSQGLQAYYPFNGNATDVSGNNNNPIFNNATLTSDALGNANSAYNFNGTSNYMQIPNSPSLNMGNQMSIAIKVRPLGWYTGQCYNNMMLIKGNTDFLQGNYSVRYADVYTGCSNPTTTEERFFAGNAIAANPLVELNRWYNIVWTYDGTISRIYVDCVLINPFLSNITSFTNSFDVFIGKMNNAQYPYWLNGDLDEIRIYNRPLTQAEVNLYGQCSTAPVTLTEFNTSIINNKAIKLTWNTEAEYNIINYSVERSTTGNAADFISLGTVKSNSNAQSNKYSFVDNTAKPNTLYYYKLVINDLDGSKKNSATKTAKIINKDFYTLIYPNPTSGIVKVFINNSTVDAKITVINELGQVVLTKNAGALVSNPALIDISSVPAGTYWVTIQTAENKVVEKIVKQ